MMPAKMAMLPVWRQALLARPDYRRNSCLTAALFHPRGNRMNIMTDRATIAEAVTAQIEPFNKKGVALSEATTFAGDLEWDSLTVMDFVAAIEDEFDIIITMNMQAEIETVGQLIDAVAKLTAE
jgi:acyl carrier protein